MSDRLTKLLKTLEYHDGDGAVCPICKKSKSEGHQEDCLMAECVEIFADRKVYVHATPEETLADMQKFKEKISNDPKKSLQWLIKAGILDENGKPSPNYYPPDEE